MMTNLANRSRVETRNRSPQEAIEEKEAQKLLPPEIVWSTVDLPSVIADIAAQQAELTLMEEGSLEQIEHKTTKLQRLNTDERSNWAKEVLDASMAMWWWPPTSMSTSN